MVSSCLKFIDGRNDVTVSLFKHYADLLSLAQGFLWNYGEKLAVHGAEFIVDVIDVLQIHLEYLRDYHKTSERKMILTRQCW